MRIDSFAMTRTGASHIADERPCQDASCSGRYGDYAFAVVADGHGNRRHFRSDRGSTIACDVAKNAICAFLDADAPETEALEARLDRMKETICTAWLDAVTEDFQEHPWSEAELEEMRGLLTEEQMARLLDGTDAAIAYGSTLCAVFTHPEGWTAIQLGDGGFARIGPDGSYDWHMPESRVNQGNRTASLCMKTPMRDFRHCCGTGAVSGLLVYTDGIEKVFPAQGRELASFLHWIWRNEYGEASIREENLARTLDTLTRRSHVGDDLSVAGLFDPEAEDVEPKLGRAQQLQELERLQAKYQELNSSAEYNRNRLEQGLKQGSLSEDTREQLTRVLRRNLEAASRVYDQIAALRAAMMPEPLDAAPQEDLTETKSETPSPQPQTPEAEQTPAEGAPEEVPDPSLLPEETLEGQDEKTAPQQGRGPTHPGVGDPEGPGGKQKAENSVRDLLRKLWTQI